MVYEPMRINIKKLELVSHAWQRCFYCFFVSRWSNFCPISHRRKSLSYEGQSGFTANCFGNDKFNHRWKRLLSLERAIVSETWVFDFPLVMHTLSLRVTFLSQLALSFYIIMAFNVQGTGSKATTLTP